MAQVAEFRVEKDTMGEIRVPTRAYYGAQTQRAVNNFPISNLRFSRRFIRALGVIKLAAARANMNLKLLEKRLGDAIVQAAEEVSEGKFDGEFVVDVFQTGSGTSTNMNVNEVIANRAAEVLGAERGDKGRVHPNDHVNMGQSTNDVFPTAMHVAAGEAIERELLPSLRILESSFLRKSKEFEDVVKAGRTHLQDAVPVTLGQEFSGYASMITHGINRIEKSKESLLELPLGGTAVGTGLNAHPQFAERTIQEINKITGLRFRRAANYFEAMQNRDALVEAHGAIKTIAVSLMKIANDLRLMYSGPKTGLAEIELPATQPGSSIMPAKVNPVIPEAVNMVAAKIIGNDVTIAVAGLNGNFELNTMMPVMAYTMLESIEVEANCSKVLAEKCVDGIKANVAQCQKFAEESMALVTAFAPIIGYDAAAKVAKKSMQTGKSLKDILVEDRILSQEKVKEIFNLKKMTRGGRAQ